MATATATSLSKLESILGTDARSLLEHKCETIPKSQLHLPGPDFVSRIFATSDRPTRVLRSLESFFDLEPDAKAKAKPIETMKFFTFRRNVIKNQTTLIKMLLLRLEDSTDDDAGSALAGSEIPFKV